jgi:hypothetical protein
MLLVMSPEFRTESSQRRLVCCCEDCAHFVADAPGADGCVGACDLLFPTAPHRRAAWASAADGAALSFCKMFEADDRPPLPPPVEAAAPADAGTFDTTSDPVALTPATRTP